MLRRCAPFLAALGVIALAGSDVLAQTTGLKTRVEQELFTFGTCGEPLCLDLDNIHGNHFLPALESGNAAVITFITDAIGRATASVPLSATSGGATFSFVGGVPVRTSTSAGPIFGERSQTLGRGRFFMGASVTGMQFTSLNGAPMQGIELNFGHDDGDDDIRGNPEFENEVINLQLDMKVAVTVGTIAMTAGLTDFIDIGVAVPLVRTSIEGRSNAQIQPFGNPATHWFAGDINNPVLRASTSMIGTASGIGDVAARMKINLGQSDRMGAALLAEVRLPTGDEENLLGSGNTLIRAQGIYSAQLGTFSPHLNLGFQASGNEAVNDKLLVLTAFDNLLTDWATLAVAVEAEIDVGSATFALPDPIVITTPFERVIPATNIPSQSADLVRASLGGKFTVREGTVIYANGIFPLTSNGLQPDYIWTLGLDFPF
ncbi:MAG: hypothetical protein AAF389_06400 [Gemmatimonadota bacterium]